MVPRSRFCATTQAVASCATLMPYAPHEWPQPVDEGEVRGEIAGMEAGQPVGARVASGGLPVVAGEQAVREHPVGGDADPQLAAGGEDAVGLGVPAEQGVFDLHIADRVYGVGTADGLRPHFGEPDVAHVPGLDQLGDRADRVLDRGVGGEARGAVDVDVVGPEAAQRVGERVLDVGGRPSMPTKAPSGPRRAPNFTLRSALSRSPGRSARRMRSSLWPMP